MTNREIYIRSYIHLHELLFSVTRTLKIMNHDPLLLLLDVGIQQLNWERIPKAIRILNAR